MRVAVMGSGSWGTAFAMVLADAGNEVVVWGRDAALAEAMTTQHENPKYQPGVVLPDSLRATTDPAEALDGAAVVVLAVPAHLPEGAVGGEFLDFETLTLCPIDTRCIERSLLGADDIEWLNAYHARVRERLAPRVAGDARAWLEARTQPI